MSKKMPVISFTRTVGYFAPFFNVNKGKQAEIKDRKLFNVKNLSELLKKKLIKQDIGKHEK